MYKKVTRKSLKQPIKSQGYKQNFIMNKPKRVFASLFIKAFALLEIFLLLFCTVLAIYLARQHHQNNYDVNKYQAREFSRIIHSHVQEEMQMIRFSHQHFTQKMKQITKGIDKIKFFFVVNSKNKLIAHSNESLIFLGVTKIYPKLKANIKSRLKQINLFRDIINQNKKIEYKYFYQYILDEKNKYPIYTEDISLVNKNMRYSLIRRLYIVWDTTPSFLFSWADGLFGFFMITQISLVFALFSEKILRKARRILEKEIDSNLNDLATNPPQIGMQQSTNLKQQEKRGIPIETKNKSRDGVRAPTEVTSSNETDQEEIPEAIILN